MNDTHQNPSSAGLSAAELDIAYTALANAINAINAMNEQHVQLFLAIFALSQVAKANDLNAVLADIQEAQRLAKN